MASSPISNLAMSFKVKRCDPELVVPSKPTPREVKKLSDLDQGGMILHVPNIWIYKNNDNPLMEGKDSVMVIKEALGRALVYYYPLAGRLKQGPNKKLVVDCNEEGVLFIEADADVTLQQLGTLRPPFPFHDEVLFNVPGSDGILGCPLLLIQVTRLKCGGFIFGLRLNHAMFDACGVAQFMKALSEMARGEKEPSVPPVWQRELLDARNPPRITHIHHEYSQNDDMTINIDSTDMVHGSFVFGPQEIREIRKHLPSHLANCSRFELLTACVWRCKTLALNLDPEEVVQLSIVMDARGGANGLSVPSGYYGNVIGIPTSVSNAGVLCRNPLGYAVELVKKAKSQMNSEYTKSVEDSMELEGRPGFKFKGIYIVSDVTKFRFHECDFGWGYAEFGGPSKAYPLNCFYINTTVEGENGVLLLLCLPSLILERFERELKKIMSSALKHIKHSKL